ncbi:DUF5684 domain-containing protein [Amycolatopsis sp. PS_44_ISF1]|uniref:DUF5684 domain-containing protein n=1 Tax=Amycolatopsis sp. PS_44_ISF1 TaxID=2974917 RepID=UPI0028E07F41|nr:DUF5684 domain-containing protein [Amycolatopsis sp. PS_44_ISF1]MDT8912640.1 DUF5684 domain-containing protein [Amycolatopsis sp. PS_44_ISF1]
MNHDNSPSVFGPGLGFGTGSGLLFLILMIIALWRVFTKAGRPGWAAIIPIYNVYVLLKIAGRSGWWLLLLLIPLVNLIVAIIVSLDVARAFGKGGLFGFFGLFLFSVIGYLILAFGSARYTRPAAR